MSKTQRTGSAEIRRADCSGQQVLFPDATGKRCKTCGVVKDATEFPIHHRRWRGNECKKCDCVRALAWRKANPARLRLIKLNNRLVKMLCDARARSRRNGMKFDEDCLQDLIRVKPVHCPCCGAEFDYSAFGRGHPRIPSIDRIDNAKGYVRGNVAIICTRCNSLKRDATLEDMKNIIAYMEGGRIKELLP